MVLIVGAADVSRARDPRSVAQAGPGAPQPLPGAPAVRLPPQPAHKLRTGLPQ